jgi:AcrR family transcriptional regulator
VDDIVFATRLNVQADAKVSKKRGRPRLFSHQRALDEAMKLFWEWGYEGTSLSDLIAVMHVGPSTFYKLFGNKERLFEKAIRHYTSGPIGRRLKNILSGQNDTRTTFQLLLEAAAFECTNPDFPTGCMISLAGTHLSPDLQSIRNTMMKLRANFETMLEDRLQRGIQMGDLASDTNVLDLASFFGTVIYGIAVQARDGKSRQHLLKLGKLAMQAWPEYSNNHSETA